MPAAVQLKLDPWASDTDFAVHLSADDHDALAPAPVDLAVETAHWAAIDPPSDAATGAAAARPVPLVFIDGVRRIDARVLAATAGNGPVPGLLGSYAVGALRASDREPELIGHAIGRLLVLGGGTEHPPLTLSLAGGGTLTYEPLAVPETEPEATLQALQTAMRRAEDELARSLAAASGGTTGLPTGALIIADGPLAYLARTPTPLAGFVKSLHRAYLPAGAAALLPQLAVGQRTPIFAICDKNQRYSWYLCLGRGGPADHELAGIARLECGSEAGIEAARAIADRSAAALVRAASTRERDPRSPQNLVPLGGLEQLLRHRLGDRALTRRAITAHLAAPRVAAPRGTTTAAARQEAR